MKTTKVFTCGNSQAVRLPKDFHFNNKTVIIIQRKHEIAIREAPKNLATAFQLLTQLPADALVDAKKDSLPQKRDSF